MSHNLKVLVVGNVFGKFVKLFNRVSDVNKKAGPFDLLLCVGDFFGDDAGAYGELITGSTELPDVPTYVLGKIPQHVRKSHPDVEDFEEGFEPVDGIIFLGSSGVLTTSQGLRIAYLNGRLCSDDSLARNENLEYFSQKNYDNLLTSLGGRSGSAIVDILLTNQWPQNIFNHTNADFSESTLKMIRQESSQLISQLCHALRPRYHFVGGLNLFFERAPFRNHKVINEPSKNVTRFISLANITNTEKMKWIYAFNLIPSKHISMNELTSQPQGVTENPFSSDCKPVESVNSSKSQQQFFYALGSSGGNNAGDNENSKRRRDNQTERQPKKQLKVEVENCWFCLASPSVDKTLIVSIGDFSYLALAKGGLTDDHMMILPIDHIRSSIEIVEENLKDEIEKFKSALIDFFKKRQMVPVFFERNFKTAHFQIQVIGLPESKAPSLKQAVSSVFSRFDFHELSLDSHLSDTLSPGVPYFFLECPNHYKFFVRINTKKEFFPIQVGRELLAHRTLLNCPERIDWKRCTSTAEDAKALTLQIRKDFKEFDFTL